VRPAGLPARAGLGRRLPGQMVTAARCQSRFFYTCVFF